MKHLTGLFVVAGLLAASPAAAELSLTISDGRVTLICSNTTARQILAEWARLGQTKVVGAEKLTGPPLTLRLEHVPEQAALEVVLRAASGYIAADRHTMVASASRYDRILIMPPSAPVAGSPAGVVRGMPAAAAPAPPQPAFTPQPADEMASEMANDDANAPVNPYAGEARPPETNFDYANPQEFLRRRQEMMQQQQQLQQQPGAPSTFPGTVLPGGMPAPPQMPVGVPGAPAGATRPGEIVRPPQVPTYMNPYGMPYPAQPPGTQGPGTMEPDRAKYANPYQPTPPRPPQDD